MSNTQQVGWIGVDLDGTLARHDAPGVDSIGEPIPGMVERVKQMLEQGLEVRIVTARACNPQVRSTSGVPAMDHDQVALIKDWCEKHLGKRLPVQFWKDYAMMELWDDRCVQILANEGMPVVEHALNALSAAEQVYRHAMQNDGQVHPMLLARLRMALGIPEPEEKSLVVPASTIPAISR